MAAAEVSTDNLFMIDEDYEFSAPRYFDFMVGETDEDLRRAELWFEKTVPYAPSPFMVRVKASRAIQPQILCNFGDDEQKLHDTVREVPAASDSLQSSEAKRLEESMPGKEVLPGETTETNLVKTGIIPCENERKDIEVENATNSPGGEITEINVIETELIPCESELKDTQLEKVTKSEASSIENGNCVATKTSSSLHMEAAQVCTPAQVKNEAAKKIASVLHNPSSLNSRKQMQKSQAKSNTKPGSIRRDTNIQKSSGASNFAHENQAIKRQKLEGGKSRQILTVTKAPNLPHKTKAGIINSSTKFSITNTKTSKEERKIYVREPPVAPFVSAAEIMRKFQSGTRDLSLPRNGTLSQENADGAMHGKPKLTLTRPKTPEFETSQRVRFIKIKSTAELEEEMMAKIPKFKARPLNKKIFEAPTLPPLPRSTPHAPEFREFHLQTMAKANYNSDTSTVASTESTEVKSSQWKPHLTAPRSPALRTSLRARPPKIKSSDEVETEELASIPQFKARPLNRKIFESKGDMGMICHMKKQLTVPQEFNFAIDKRIPPPSAVLDQFDKLSISSEAQQDKRQLPRNTTPNPFHLYTEERGAEKEKRLAEELRQKQLEEEWARVPKAHPYPYTTDFPEVPPKPEPKPCTKPEPFQLESLIRHEEEMQREIEERRRKEMEEAQMRQFKALPILKEDPIPVPEKIRKPLTEVQEFNLHVEHRAVDRAEFDKKVKEKEIVYKRYREEAESAKMMEEEKALKQLRRTLIPHARPAPNFERVFLPQRSSKPATKAKSPKLLVDRRHQNRGMGHPTGATPPTTAAPFLMR